ncbi:MAG: glycerol-3-phosphate dehydrogenase [Xanthobacteraceae bacterium]|nr:MAG: glycerol-3-phosphate dehydrogenase [Xanthobacteraceae bacterium]
MTIRTPANKEGSTEAPTRHALDWQSEAFYDQAAIDKEMERVFDICHGCRRCFNLCDSFPTLFDMIDASPTGEVNGVDKADYKKVVDACTLCDMCFMTKCPYVPPHPFNLDFPHLMLRYRAAEFQRGEIGFATRQLARIDRNAMLAGPVAPLANWATRRGNGLTRPIMQKVLGVDADAALPSYRTTTFSRQAAQTSPSPHAPARGRKAVVYATCFVDYHQPITGHAALHVLAKNGVETEVVYPACCGMPQLEHGDLAQVAANARKVAAELCQWIDKGYDVISLTASCGLMLKFEWPLILPDDEQVRKLAAATFDISQYIVDIAKKEGLAPGLEPVEGGVTVHMACHARAQNIGAKSAEMLGFIPGLKVDVVERCSGHGGTFGVMVETRPHALKGAKPTAQQIKTKANDTLCSDCPLACKHLVQVIGDDATAYGKTPHGAHAIEVMARAYGFAG